VRDLALIADALAECEARGEPAVLATVVRTEGSTYRRAGARMLLRRGGRTAGAVSGGCLEADLAARLDDLLAGGRAELVTYDTRAGDDIAWGLGLGCNGRVDVLLEPLAGEALARARALHARCRDLTEPAVLTTVIAEVIAESGGRGPRVGGRLLLTDRGETVSLGLAPDAVPAELVADAREALATRRSAVRSYAPARDDGGALEAVHEVVLPPLALLVCGAGFDAVPLVRLGVGMGWRVTVVDHRPDHVRPDRFPGATVRLVGDDAAAAEVGPGHDAAYDAAVVMSHHYERDLAHVGAVLAAGVPYVGVLGPRRRTLRMIADLGVGDADAARLYAPVGLDIGAETPDEIALAVVAEVQAVRAGRRGGPLRERPGAIHDDPREAKAPRAAAEPAAVR
jgi:xanthine/CO dehydrogenase XdhC/CoxF family maturation factor